MWHKTLNNALQVPIAVTPDGRADAVSYLPDTGEQVFALPFEGRMKINALLDALTLPAASKAGKNILYLQQQNDCLRKDLSELMEDCVPLMPWADKIFASLPEAVNLWIGGSESVTSFHKDHYENMYAVIAGQKIFHLLPPCDHHCLRTKLLPAAQYERIDDLASLTTTRLQLRKLESHPEVKWSSIDPRHLPGQSHVGHPQLKKIFLPALTATIHPGEVLYLPSLWHHFVEQDAPAGSVCIAVNLWYDMVFDTKFAYFNLVEKLGDLISCK